MTRGRVFFSAAVTLGTVLFQLFVPSSSMAQEQEPTLAWINISSHTISWEPIAGDHKTTLAVSGPPGVAFQGEFDVGETVYFEIVDENGKTLPDGSYTYELRAIPSVPADTQKRTEDEVSGDKDAPVQSGSFTILNGSVVLPSYEQEYTGGVITKSAETNLTDPAIDGPLDQVILDDLIVDGSLCVGFDCVNGESFGFDTIRLKENNIRIKFQDTSNSGSFPSNDWQITANDSANGGANKFSIDDITGGRTPFTIEASAPSNSLYIDDGGLLGLGTATPIVDVHVVSGNTPTLRLEQNGSSGFSPQTFDVAGNETNFFIRDATNGSTLPLRIRPGAPTSSIDVENTGDVGFGTSSPSASIHVVRSTGSQAVMLKLQNNAAVQTELADTTGNTWRFGLNNAGHFVINDTADLGTAEMRITPDGQVYVNGTQAHPDYVFEPGYSLMPLGELREFIKEKGHLPNVVTAEERELENGFSLTELPLQLLEKIEELTLYVLEQEETISAQKAAIEQLRERLKVLENAGQPN